MRGGEGKKSPFTTVTISFQECSAVVHFIAVNRKLRKSTRSASSFSFLIPLFKLTAEHRRYKANRNLELCFSFLLSVRDLKFLVSQIFWLCTTVHANKAVSFAIKWIRMEECLLPLLNRTLLLGLQNWEKAPVNQHYITALSVSIILHPGRCSISSAFKLLCRVMSCTK